MWIHLEIKFYLVLYTKLDEQKLTHVFLKMNLVYSFVKNQVDLNDKLFFKEISMQMKKCR